MKLYMFRTVHLSIIRTLFTVHSAMVYYVCHKVCRDLSSRTRMELQICIYIKKIMSTQLAHKAAENSRGDTGVTWLITFRGWEGWGWGANRPLVLATLIYEGVRLQRARRLVTTSPVHTYTPFPYSHSIFFICPSSTP